MAGDLWSSVDHAGSQVLRDTENDEKIDFMLEELFEDMLVCSVALVVETAIAVPGGWVVAANRLHLI